MIRKEPERGGGRRPLLAAFSGNNRQMLTDIRDNLSHVIRSQVAGDREAEGLVKTESSHVTPNVVDKSATSSGTKKGLENHTKALAEIRAALRPFQTGGEQPQNGSDTQIRQDIQQVMALGVDEDIAVHALKLCGSVEGAVHLVCTIRESCSGSSRASNGLTGYPVHRKPSFESKYGASSPAPPDTHTIRSSSPSLNPSLRPLVNGHQTPPPLPPRSPFGQHGAPSSQPRGHTPPPPQADGAAGIGGHEAQAPSVDIPSGHVQQLIRRISPAQYGAQVIHAQPHLARHAHLDNGGKAQLQQATAMTTSLHHNNVMMNGGQVHVQQQQPAITSASSIHLHHTAAMSALVGRHPMAAGQVQGQSQGQGGASVQAVRQALTQQLQQDLAKGHHNIIPSPSSTPSSTPTPSGPRLTVLARPPPPPYSPGQAGVGWGQMKGEQSHLLGSNLLDHHFTLAGADSPLNQSTASSSAFSALSDGGNVTMNTVNGSGNLNNSGQLPAAGSVPVGAGAPVVASRFPMAPHAPVVMQSVKSKHVTRPIAQTATAPLSHPSSNMQHNGISKANTSVASPHFPVASTAATITATTSTSTPRHNTTSTPTRSSTNTHTRNTTSTVARNVTNTHTRNATSTPTRNSTSTPTLNTSSAHTHNTSIIPSHTTGNCQMQVTSMTAFHVVHSHPHPSGPHYATEPTLPQGPAYGRHTGSGTHISGPSVGLMAPSHLHNVTGVVRDLCHPVCMDSVSGMGSESPVSRTTNLSPLSVLSTTSSLSTSCDVPDKPPPPYPYSLQASQPPLPPRIPLHRPSGQPTPSSGSPRVPPSVPCGQNGVGAGNETTSEVGEDTDTETVSSSEAGGTCGSGRVEKHRCLSPIPERKPHAWEQDELRRDTKLRYCSPQAFKFFMEQHVENVLKIHQQRLRRRMQLEKEMAKVNLSEDAAHQIRRMLYQKESNYIRLKRAKMDRSLFDKICTLGKGAFGEVALCRKKDTRMLYAMKTLRKAQVLRTNQVAHVKAERDILAEADNEWVVKLYYSFQDLTNLYFVMEYVPGGDLMGLLVRLDILDEPLAQFYIAELVQAIDSVHRMGFIHRDIKPDNVLIDRDGHIKLTDFGLCTGFRWTHNSKYYQEPGSHARQDSMEVSCQLDEQCHCEIIKPLERRQKRAQRCLAHSLVGTPNYIAPEVLLRSEGYTKVCDWWSVGVILFEMLVGHPPFYAVTPDETQNKVIRWKEELQFPPKPRLSSQAADLIVKLCCGSDERLGLNGAGEVKAHPFFHDVDFDTLRKQQAPYVPNIRYATDTSNFDPVDPDRLHSSDCEENRHGGTGENGKHVEHAFLEFTFRRFFDDGGHPMACTVEDLESNPAEESSNPSVPPLDSNSPVYV